MKKITIVCSLLATISLYSQQIQKVDLDEAINIALKNNNKLKISKTSIKIAQQMYKQAMSANYPTIDLNIIGMRMDQDPTYDMVGTTIVDNTATKAIYNSLSQAALADGDNVLSATYAGISAATPDQSVLPIDMEVKVANRDSLVSQINMQYPLYVGGKIQALQQQAKLGKKIAQVGYERDKNQVILDVKKYYYSVVLTKQLKQLSSDTLSRMEFLKELTSRLYQGGSMHVKKTDYLRSKLSVNLIKSLDNKISQKEELAKSALLNAMGLRWEDEIEIKDQILEEPIMSEQMDSLIKKAYQFNPDFNTLNLALDIQDAKIDESKSDFLPHIGINASAQNIKNSYDFGIVNDNNKNSWTLGIGATWSLFNGGKTTHEVEQKRLEKLKLQQTKIVLEQGIALQIKQAFLNMKSAYEQFLTLKEAVVTAKQNRELNTRAYQEDMVQTKDVIESQLFEAYTQGDFYKAQYDYAVAKAQLDYIVGVATKENKRR